MKKRIIINILLLGFLSWLIPFVVSIFFFKPGGELVIPYPVFKSIMMVVGVISGCYLLLRYFKSIETDFIRQGIIVGAVWFAINLLLDICILVPMMKTTIADYLLSIGLSYFSIPAISIAFGYLLSSKTKPE